jgi:hypothetical protein
MVHARAQTYQPKAVTFAEDLTSTASMIVSSNDDDFPRTSLFPNTFWHPVDAAAAAEPVGLWDNNKDNFDCGCNKKNRSCKCIPKTENICQRCCVGCEEQLPFKKETMTVTTHDHGFPLFSDQSQQYVPCRCVDDYICRICSEKHKTKQVVVVATAGSNAVLSCGTNNSWRKEESLPLGRTQDDPMCLASPVKRTAATDNQEFTPVPKYKFTPVPTNCTPWLENLNRPTEWAPSRLQLRGVNRKLFASCSPSPDPPVMLGNDDTFITKIPFYEI